MPLTPSLHHYNTMQHQHLARALHRTGVPCMHRLALCSNPWHFRSTPIQHPSCLDAAQSLSVRRAARMCTSATSTTHADHNQQQASAFSSPEVLRTFKEALPDDIKQRLSTIIGSIPGLSSDSRVIDVGSGTGCLIPFLQARGVKDILAVDLSAAMLEQLRKLHGADNSHLGNETGVRTWHGDIVDLPNYLGWAADAFIFNGVFGNLHSPRAGLLKAALQLKPGGHIVISHPLGRTWHSELARQQPDITPHQLPDRAALDQLIQGLPLQVMDYRDEQDLYLVVLQVPPRYHFPGAPVLMKGAVVKGFGRGSRQLGTPTANLSPAQVKDALGSLQQGVYFGWAQLVGDKAEWPEQDLQVHKMVMNVGRRPTVNAGDEDDTLEVHIMHEFSKDFYGQEVQAVALGYIRPEMKFTGGFPELLNRIRLDVAIGRNQLDDPVCQEAKKSLVQ